MMVIHMKRLWEHIQILGEIGRNEDGSITRLPFTIEDHKAQELLKTWMLEAGMQVNIDAVGNIIGTYTGVDNHLQPVICGSHYDTVKCGGMFDGCLGVLSGIEVIQTMHEQGFIPLRSIQIIAFKDEEGNRFGYGMIGSKAISGNVDTSGFQSKDVEGITLYQAMCEAGLHPALYDTCKLDPYAFIEVHIEQAKVLDNGNKAIGIVDGIAGLARYTITFKGESAHAGATPMHQRKDPVIAMSRWILYMRELASSYPHTVATIGDIHTYPGSCNIICDHVECSLDLRSIKDEIIVMIMQKMQVFQEQLTQEEGVIISISKEQVIGSAPCDTKLISMLEAICEKEDEPYLHIMSGAGHDCMNFKDVCPTAMIFVRSKDGYSHRKEEYSTMEDCGKGADILYKMLKKITMNR